MATRAWESICRRCGRCCFEKIEFEGEVYFTDTPCEMLDPATRFCRVYARRQQVRPGCIVLTPRLVRKGFLPADCPYVSGLPGYKAPRLWDSEEDR